MTQRTRLISYLLYVSEIGPVCYGGDVVVYSIFFCFKVDRYHTLPQLRKETTFA